MECSADDSASGGSDADETRRYLERRVREEACAAARATSVEATLIHVSLATAYARRFGASSAPETSGASWVQEQRVW